MKLLYFNRLTAAIKCGDLRVRILPTQLVNGIAEAEWQTDCQIVAIHGEGMQLESSLSIPILAWAFQTLAKPLA